MRKKGIPEVLVRSVMSPYEGVKTRVKVDCELSEEFEVKVGMQQGCVLSPYVVVADVATEFARAGALGELLYADDDLVQMSETMEGLWNKFLKWKWAFESKGLEANFGKPG